MRWIKVKFDDNDRWVIDRIKKEREVREWCHKNFPNGQWLIYEPGIIEFKHKKEAVLFALKWS